MANKQRVYTSLSYTHINSVSVNGSGDDYRVSLHQKVHHGPSAFLDRQVTLIMDPEEAIKVGLAMLSAVPVHKLEQYKERLLQLVRVIEAGST